MKKAIVAVGMGVAIMMTGCERTNTTVQVGTPEMEKRITDLEERVSNLEEQLDSYHEADAKAGMKKNDELGESSEKEVVLTKENWQDYISASVKQKDGVLTQQLIAKDYGEYVFKGVTISATEHTYYLMNDDSQLDDSYSYKITLNDDGYGEQTIDYRWPEEYKTMLGSEIETHEVTGKLVVKE